MKSKLGKLRRLGSKGVPPVKLKRIYQKAEKGDGFRILVDRLWPRGLSREKAEVDLSLKETAPSDRLRKWFDHDPEKWDAFRKKYREELTEKKALLNEIRNRIKKENRVTLLYAAGDPDHNNAVVLMEHLDDKL